MIQPEPEGSTQGYLLDSVEVLRFYTSAGNPVKEILLKLNLPDHRILKDGGEVTEGSSETTTEGYMENNKNVSQDIRDQMNAEAKSVQIILTGIDNDIYSTLDACPNACKMWKEIERLKQGLGDRGGAAGDGRARRKCGEGMRELGDASGAGGHLSVSIWMFMRGEVHRRCVGNLGYSVKIVKGKWHEARECSETKTQRMHLYPEGKMLTVEHPEQPKSINDTYLEEQGDTNITIDSLIMKSTSRRNVDKLKGEIEDFKTKNKSLESSNSHFKEANNELSKTNQLMFKDLKKFQAELDRYHDVNYASKVAIDCAKAKGDLIPQLKSNQLEYRVMRNNSEGKKQQVEDHRRNFRFSNNKTSVTACNDRLKAKTSNVNFVCVTCGKCVSNDNHDMCVLHYLNCVNSRTKQPIVVPISNREPKRTVNQSAATTLKRTVAAESTNQKPRSTIRKQ
ncbi:hypothetical protein Tco_0236689 [Tanacetum coccineum]